MATDPPTSLDEAHARRRVLISDIQSTQVELGDQYRTDPTTGQRMSFVVYNAWRKETAQRLTVLMGQLRELNDWIKHEQRRRSAHRPDDVLEMLRRSYLQFQTLVEEETPFDQHELDFFEEIRACLGRHGVEVKVAAKPQ